MTDHDLMLPDDPDQQIGVFADSLKALHEGLAWLQKVGTGEIAADQDTYNSVITVMDEKLAQVGMIHAQIAPLLTGAKELIETLSAQRDEARDYADHAYEEGMIDALSETSFEDLLGVVSESLTNSADYLAARLRAKGDVAMADNLEAVTQQAVQDLATVNNLQDQTFVLAHSHWFSDGAADDDDEGEDSAEHEADDFPIITVKPHLLNDAD
jgi:hypothetical protein